MSWSTFDEKKKVKQFSKYSCHELNYFLFKRDKPFFKLVVLNFIKSKMEKSFIDWYLLAADETIENQFVKRILEYAENEALISTLNLFEKCLFLEICIDKGLPQHIAKAKGLAQFMVNVPDD